MIVSGKFEQLELHTKSSLAKDMAKPGYFGVFNSLAELSASLKGSSVAIGEFHSEDGTVYFVISDLPKVGNELGDLTTAGYELSVSGHFKPCLLNLKEAVDEQGRKFYYMLDVMVVK